MRRTEPAFIQQRGQHLLTTQQFGHDSFAVPRILHAATVNISSMALQFRCRPEPRLCDYASSRRHAVLRRHLQRLRKPVQNEHRGRQDAIQFCCRPDPLLCDYASNRRRTVLTRHQLRLRKPMQNEHRGRPVQKTRCSLEPPFELDFYSQPHTKIHYERHFAFCFRFHSILSVADSPGGGCELVLAFLGKFKSGSCSGAGDICTPVAGSVGSLVRFWALATGDPTPPLV